VPAGSAMLIPLVSTLYEVRNLLQRGVVPSNTNTSSPNERDSFQYVYGHNTPKVLRRDQKGPHRGLHDLSSRGAPVSPFIPIFFRRAKGYGEQGVTHPTLYFPKTARVWYMYEPFRDSEWEYYDEVLEYIAGETSFDFVVGVRV